MKLRGVSPSRTGIRMIAGRSLNQFDLRDIQQHLSLGYDRQSLYQKTTSCRCREWVWYPPLKFYLPPMPIKNSANFLNNRENPLNAISAVLCGSEGESLKTYVNQSMHTFYPARGIHVNNKYPQRIGPYSFNLGLF
jgi:hypothetical protein